MAIAVPDEPGARRSAICSVGELEPASGEGLGPHLKRPPVMRAGPAPRDCGARR
jgi:hypothetical protein